MVSVMTESSSVGVQKRGIAFPVRPDRHKGLGVGDTVSIRAGGGIRDVREESPLLH